MDEDEDPLRHSLLHIAAKQNFLHVAKCLVEHYPGLMYMETEEDQIGQSYLPVELALLNFKDETAAYLISQMKHDWYVNESLVYVHCTVLGCFLQQLLCADSVWEGRSFGIFHVTLNLPFCLIK